MTRMIRKQIYLEKRQAALLKRLAKMRGISEAEIVRSAIDHQINSGTPGSKHPNPEAFEKAYRFMLSRRALGSSSKQAYRWKREDAYEERLSRYDRKLN